MESEQTSVGAPAAAPVGPAGGTDRLDVIDVLRGVAVLGILIVNMALFTQPVYSELFPRLESLSAADRTIALGIALLAQGKFISIFATLFGVGVTLQWDRIRRRGGSRSILARRLLILLGIGTVHAFGLWFGDILMSYGTVGFALLIVLALRLSPRALLWLGCSGVAVALLLNLSLNGLMIAVERFSPELLEPIYVEQEAEMESAWQQCLERYPIAGYLEIVRLNASQWLVVLTPTLLLFPLLLGLFCFGAAWSRLGVFQDSARWVPRFRRALPILFPIALVLNLGLPLGKLMGSGLRPNLWAMGTMVSLILGAPLLGHLYGMLLVVLHGTPTGRRRLSPLAATGRMALTHYLTHTVVFTTLNNGYGFGFYGSISPTVGLLLTLGMFALQVPLSVWWLRQFRYGPLEWLWRSLTYLRVQPFRR